MNTTFYLDFYDDVIFLDLHAPQPTPMKIAQYVFKQRLLLSRPTPPPPLSTQKLKTSFVLEKQTTCPTEDRKVTYMYTGDQAGGGGQGYLPHGEQAGGRGQVYLSH